MRIEYTPADWFWIVAGDESRYWSSASATYVDSLPDGGGVSRIASEAELDQVLIVYGLPSPLRALPNLEPDQFWGILRATGYEQAVHNWVASIEDPMHRGFVSAKLEYAKYFERNHPMIEAARVAIGMSAQELDQLWAWGAS